MIHQFGFVSEETFSEKMDTQNRFLAALVTAQGGALKPTSWAEIQALVRAGLHKNVFSIGDQLVCQKGSSSITWDVIGIDHDTPADSQFTHSLTLQLHDCLSSQMQVDAPEALYYAENGLVSGTYNFTIQGSYTPIGGTSKTFQFTLTDDVPAGGQLTFSWAYNTQAGSAKITSYGADLTTVIESGISVTEGSSGTSLGTTDGNSTNLNFIEKARFGSNNYSESAIRQFLNSNNSAGSVWAPQTNFDRPPTWANNTAGFMSDLDSDFLAVVGTANKVTCLNTVADGGGSITTTDKFFLLSRSEVYGGNENGAVNEGGPYAYYKDYSDLSEAGIGNDTNRIKYRNQSATSWLIRTPLSSGAGNIRTINTSGASNSTGSYSSSALCPACVII